MLKDWALAIAGRPIVAVSCDPSVGASVAASLQSRRTGRRTAAVRCR